MGKSKSNGKAAKAAPVNNVIGGVIHYHRDTELIHDTLTKEAAYDTSKGKAVYKGRSQSNGKLLFIHCESRKNVYFTKQEWEEGSNSPDKIDKDYMEKARVKSVESVKEAVKGLISGKSTMMDRSDKTDPFSGEMAIYGGVNTNGIKVLYQSDSKPVVYFHADEFAKRFKVVDVGFLTEKEAADRAKGNVVKSVKKGNRKKR